MQIKFLALVVFISLSSQTRDVSCRLLQAGAERSPQDASIMSPLQNDLNRTSSRIIQKTTRPTAATRVVRLDNVAAQSISTSRRVAAPPDVQHETDQRSVSSGSQQLIASLANVRTKWRLMELTLSKSMLTASSELRKQLDEINLQLAQQGKQISASCKHSLDGLASGLRDQELWAVQMMDSSAASRGLPSGLLEGTLTDLGRFDQCLAIGQEMDAPESGQYCSVLVKPMLPARPRLHTVCRRMPELLPIINSNAKSLGTGNATLKLLSQQSHQFFYAGLRLGICLPSSCTQPEVERIVKAHLVRFELIGQVKYCQRADQTSRDEAAPRNSTLGTISTFKSLLFSQSILQNFDLLQQSILLAYLTLAIFIALGTWLDDCHVRRAPPLTPAIKNTSLATGVCSHLTSTELAQQPAARKRCAWAHQQFQDQTYHKLSGSCSHVATAGSERPLNPTEESRLGLQKNPLIKFTKTDCLSSPPLPVCSEGCESRHETDNQIHKAPPHGNKRRCQSVGSKKLVNIKAELVPSGEEICLAAARIKPSLMREFIVCFSFKRNLRSIGKLAAQSGGNSPTSETNLANAMSDIKVIHGLRTLSMIWIIFGHTIGLVIPEMMNNLFALANLSCSSRLLQAMLNTTLAVDTFFMISGLVTVVSFVRKCKSALFILIEPSGSSQHVTNIPNNQKPLPKSSGHEYQAGTIYSVNNSQHLDRLELDVDSANSTASVSSASRSDVSSPSSCTSSNKCIGLSSKSSSQKNFVLNKALRSDEPAQAGWPKDFEPFTWLVMRYLRLTPAYGAVICLAILMPALGSGPFWPETVGQMGAACRTNWWTNLLYVNNFIETDNLCLIHSWYLSNDWQFFLIALVLFGVAYKSWKFALILLVGLFVASSATTFIVTMDNDYPPTIVTTSPAVAERWQFIYLLYYKPWPHLPSYLIGLLVGCMILRLQLTNAARARLSQCAGQWTRKSSSPSSCLDLSPCSRFFCWLLAILIALAVLNSIYPWNMGIEVDPILTGLHSATFRTLWATCCAWLVFALVTRPRNPLALFLGWHGFQVTSRLTYCVYLIHPLVIYYHFGMLRERIDSSIYGQLHRFMGTLLTSYLLAFLISICLEGPFIEMQKFLSRWLKRSKSGDRTGLSQANLASKQRNEKYCDRTWRSTTARSSVDKNANASASSSFTNGGGCSTESESSVPPLKVIRNQSTGQFIVRPIECFLDEDDQLVDPFTCRQLDSGLSDPRMRSQQTSACGHQELGGGGGGGGGSAICQAGVPIGPSALDEEFQRKLAQAIGRGFKIRSKIVNQTTRKPLAGNQSRKHDKSREPNLSSGESGFGQVFAPDQLEQRRLRPVQQNQQAREMPIRRLGTCTTFASPAQRGPSDLEGNGRF